jgi:hypothetical protein
MSKDVPTGAGENARASSSWPCAALGQAAMATPAMTAQATTVFLGAGMASSSIYKFENKGRAR